MNERGGIEGSTCKWMARESLESKDTHELTSCSTRTWVNAMSRVFAFRINKQNGCQSGCVETDRGVC